MKKVRWGRGGSGSAYANCGGRRLENRIVQDYLSKATSLPASTELMEEEIVVMEKEHEGSSSELHLPLSDTLALVSSSEAELARLEKELATVNAALPKKMARLKLLEDEIKPMEMDKEGLERFASEAVRMRDSARAEGKADRENMGRWYVEWIFQHEEGQFLNIDFLLQVQVSIRGLGVTSTKTIDVHDRYWASARSPVGVGHGS